MLTCRFDQSTYQVFLNNLQINRAHLYLAIYILDAIEYYLFLSMTLKFVTAGDHDLAPKPRTFSVQVSETPLWKVKAIAKYVFNIRYPLKLII